MLALIVLTIVTLALVAGGVYDRAESRRAIQHLLAAQDAERWSWSRERWDLVTRCTSPEVSRYAPPPPPPPPLPTGRGPAEPVPHTPDAEPPDESHLL